MLGQSAHGLVVFSDGLHSIASTVQVKNRDTMAEVALTRSNNIETEDWEWAQVGIIQMVSDSGVENFEPYRQAVFRKNVTSVTFEVFVENSTVRGRMMLNFWS